MMEMTFGFSGLAILRISELRGSRLEKQGFVNGPRFLVPRFERRGSPKAPARISESA